MTLKYSKKINTKLIFLSVQNNFFNYLSRSIYEMLLYNHNLSMDAHEGIL